MTSTIVQDLRSKSDAAWANLGKQLQGLEPYMERSDAPGRWTTREVLSHLLGGPGLDLIAFLGTFSERNLPVHDLQPGESNLTDERRKMTLKQFVDALHSQRRSVLAYVEGLSDVELQQRKAVIPVFKQFLGTDEFSIAMLVGILFEGHWNGHAGQLAKIRKAVGLPEAK